MKAYLMLGGRFYAGLPAWVSWTTATRLGDGFEIVQLYPQFWDFEQQ